MRERVISRHRMKSLQGKMYLVSQLRDESGVTRMELSDGSSVERVSGPLYRIVHSGKVVREIGADFSLAELRED